MALRGAQVAGHRRAAKRFSAHGFEAGQDVGDDGIRSPAENPYHDARIANRALGQISAVAEKSPQKPPAISVFGHAPCRHGDAGIVEACRRIVPALQPQGGALVAGRARKVVWPKAKMVHSLVLQSGAHCVNR